MRDGNGRVGMDVVGSCGGAAGRCVRVEVRKSTEEWLRSQQYHLFGSPTCG